MNDSASQLLFLLLFPALLLLLLQVFEICCTDNVFKVTRTMQIHQHFCSFVSSALAAVSQTQSLCMFNHNKQTTHNRNSTTVQKQTVPLFIHLNFYLLNHEVVFWSWVFVLFCFFLSQLRSYNRHTLVADPYEDGFGDYLLKKQRMIELEKKVRLSASVRAALLKSRISLSAACFVKCCWRLVTAQMRKTQFVY